MTRPGREGSRSWYVFQTLTLVVALVALGLSFQNHRQGESRYRQAQAIERTRLEQEQETIQLAREADSRSGRALALAEESDRAFREAPARSVTVGEVPREFYLDMARRSTEYVKRTTLAVYNPTPLPIVGVWVDGKEGRSVRIDEIPGCTYYTLPPDFIPSVLYFKGPDAGNGWQYDVAERTHRNQAYVEMPPEDTDDAPYDFRISWC